jgi:hypothetical protein
VRLGLKAFADKAMLAAGTMLRTLPVLLLAASAATCQAQDAPPALVGTVDAGVYTSPTGAFKIEVPVLPELGGVVRDTAEVVTFRDSFGLQVTVGAFAHDATQRWELSTRGTKDYLIYFFSNYVLRDFKSFCPGASLQSAGFSANFLDGSLFTFVLLPGGSMFGDRQVFGAAGGPPVAKRGNLVFVKNGFTFVISTELSERVTEGTRYNKTTQQEDEILRSRLLGLTKKMQFTNPAPAQPPQK